MSDVYKNHVRISPVKENEKNLTHSQLRRKKLDRALSKVSNGVVPSRTRSALSAFCYYPKHVGFINKDPKEEVILMLRKHPITNLNWIFIAILLVLAPLTLGFFPFFTELLTSFKIVIILIWYLMTAAFVLEGFLTWFFNVNIITDERVVDVDFHNLIFREVTDANIDQIQDVTVRIGGGLRTFFNYGDIIIQTAAGILMIEFIDIPKPDQVASVLRELRIEEEVEKIEGRVR